MEHSANLRRFQELLRGLFQLDLADLDFGVYRLLHLKRREVEAFLTEQLPGAVDQAFESVAATEKVNLQKQIAELAVQIKEQVADDAIGPTSDPNPAYAKIKLIQEYQARRQQMAAIQVNEAHKSDVFNHLYNFFSRYYEDGDFIPRRRYGARETYAVPYDGQEVFIHWANRNQHYVKTAETFMDYAFKVATVAGDFRVRFVLTAASVSKDNTKGDRRYFFPRPDGVAYDKGLRELRIPFEYRLPTDDDIEAHKKTDKAKQPDQANILAAAMDFLLKKVPDATLRAALAKDQQAETEKETSSLPLLLKRMMHFARRSTSDYFVDKDLRGFLRCELEFYLKDQVLHIEDLAGDFEAKRRMIAVLRTLGEQVIEFLAQIEDAQRRLFEKKKFILRTDYLIPIQHVPREFWPEVARNKAQIQQWKDWFAIEPKKDIFNDSGKINDKFLEAHPTLAMDTRHFDLSWTRRVLEALPLDDIDEAIDGLVIHSENYQALRLLSSRFAGQIACVFIDPPYNTGSDEFIFKDRYQHSSWIAMMAGRLVQSLPLMQRQGLL